MCSYKGYGHSYYGMRLISFIILDFSCLLFILNKFCVKDSITFFYLIILFKYDVVLRQQLSERVGRAFALNYGGKWFESTCTKSQRKNI